MTTDDAVEIYLPLTPLLNILLRAESDANRRGQHASSHELLLGSIASVGERRLLKALKAKVIELAKEGIEITKEGQEAARRDTLPKAPGEGPLPIGDDLTSSLMIAKGAKG